MPFDLRRHSMTILAVVMIVGLSAAVVIVGGPDAFDSFLEVAMPSLVALLAVMKAEDAANSAKDMSKGLNGQLDKRIQESVEHALKTKDET